MPIRSYLLPEYAEGNVARLSEIKNHIATQVSMFGEYPFLDTKYGIVAASFPGGMKHPTLTPIGSSILANASRDSSSTSGSRRPSARSSARSWSRPDRREGTPGVQAPSATASRTAAITSSTCASVIAGQRGIVIVESPMRSASGNMPRRKPKRSR